MMIDIQLLGLLNSTLQDATLLFIAALGELITEKSGILNLGVEGMISIGAVAGFITGNKSFDKDIVAMQDFFSIFPDRQFIYVVVLFLRVCPTSPESGATH